MKGGTHNIHVTTPGHCRLSAVRIEKSSMTIFQNISFCVHETHVGLEQHKGDDKALCELFFQHACYFSKITNLLCAAFEGMEVAAYMIDMASSVTIIGSSELPYQKTLGPEIGKVTMMVCDKGRYKHLIIS